ncbi:hypothetical protein [Chryseobacterium binzhouense]|uniref:hypothetical protein n=1 Tax=Chryseobacterium binzhouense TaxID=2593646 RepID=UPI00117E36DE|nr:hypothetical protein [Chryseobacterium binzhouense]
MDIKYAYYNTSKGYRVLGGTAAQFLKADGSLDSNNYSLSGHTHAFSQITSKPTTASGYGITDVPRQAVLGGDVNSVRSVDTRNTNPLPSTDIKAGVWFDFKSNSAIELNNFPVGTYSASMTFVPYSDNSGNNNTAFRLVQSSNNLFFQNYNNTWGVWNKIFHTGNFNPLEYASVNHTHTFASLTSKPTTLAGYGITDGLNNVYLSSKSISDANLVSEGTQTNYLGGSNRPSGTMDGSLLSLSYSSAWTTQLYGDWRTNDIYLRSQTAGNWISWVKLLHTGNFNPAIYVTQSSLNSQLSGVYATLNGVQTFTSTNTFSQSPVIPNGTLGTHAVNKNQIELITNSESEGGQQLTISGNNSVKLTNFFVTSRDGSRNPDDIAPNSTPKRVRFDFANATSAGLGASGNYAGIMTFAPWDGTSASTGDSSYQLAFANQNGVNGSGVPMLKIRKGIDGKWTTSWYKFWTQADFTSTNIQQWNYMAQYGLQLNSDFTVNTGAGLLIADDYFGGESGMVDRNTERFVSAKQESFYKYGSLYGNFDGLNFNLDTRLFGMGRESNKEDKLTVEGSVKASKNFKSEEERPDTIFIPNGNVASLRDEIVNDESEYAIRLDPHEYEIDPSGYLDVDDRNRLIHIVGEQIKMVVNFKEIYPKQQIVIYNFDKYGGTMAVKIYGKDIYHIPGGAFLRLYVTKSRRVIAERDLPCEFVW